MISIARTFGAPLTVPAGNVARNTSTAFFPSTSSPATWLVRCMTCEYRSSTMSSSTCSVPNAHDPPDVVSGEIDEHHVLGALLRVFGELGGHAPVVGFGATAPSGARDRTADDAPVEQLHHRLRRRAHQRGLGVAHEVHVGRRVDLPQHAVHVERVEVPFEVEALRDDDLEDVAGENVLARRFDRGVVRARPHGRRELRQLVELAGGRRRGYVRQRTRQLVDP